MKYLRTASLVAIQTLFLFLPYGCQVKTRDTGSLVKQSEISVEHNKKQAHLNISKEKALEIGKLIWKNECGNKVHNLTFWSQNESFPSLGIGHFIWYPKAYKGPFKERFPQLLEFLKEEGVKLPRWLETSRYCPWKTRAAFKNEFHGRKMNELRQLLYNTMDLQAVFITKRLEKTLPQITQKLPKKQKNHISQNFFLVANAPKGLYALIDYVNFKGEGYSAKESYNKQGWGLLQVLNNMDDKLSKEDPVKAFALSAKKVLKLRVQNSPKERNEHRWLKGWFNRIDSYTS
ncbi:MAG: hypothetical protein ACI9S8_000078 [Chlamydiales bacterium]|jgi:hypothetical protein